MIKVLRIINRFNLGGPTYNATFLSCFLPEEYETLLCGGRHEKHEGDSLFIPENYGVTPMIIEEMERELNFSKDRKAIRKIREIIREYQPDVVHTHASKSGAIGRYAAWKENVPVIVHTFHGHVFHSYFGSVKTNFYKRVERFLAKKSDAIIAISTIQKEELTQIHKISDPSKIRVIPLGFDLDRFQENRFAKRKAFRKKYGVGEEEVAIGMIGRLAPVKNHSGFLEALKGIKTKVNQPTKVFIVGDGELMNTIKEQATEYFQEEDQIQLIFTSWIKNVANILPAFDLVALSSHNEGTPVSLIEAQAAQVPVISTNVGGVSDIVLSGETGIIVDDFTPSGYGEALLDLINNEEKRQKMSQNGWNFVKEKFHYNRLCADVADLYAELLEKKKKNEG